MLPTANKAREYEEQIIKKRHELEELQEEFKNFKEGANA